MVLCKFCDDKTEYEWYEDHLGKWRLGLKLDINNFRQHKCGIQQKETSSNKRNWISFVCEKCGNKVRQNVKLIKTLNLCIECSNH